jgi:hypothetical protein
MIKKSNTRELLDYSGIFSIIVVSFFAIVAMLQYGNFNLLMHVFSDLGIHPSSALIFHIGIIVKASIDLIYIRHLIAQTKLYNSRDQLIYFMSIITFVMIAVFTKAPETNYIHWFFVFATFACWIYIQYRTSRQINNKLFIANTDFLIFFELVFVVVTLSNPLFWGIGEVIMFAMIVYWMWLTQRELLKI